MTDNYTLEAGIELYKYDIDNNAALDKVEFAYMAIKNVHRYRFNMPSSNALKETREEILNFYDIVDCDGDGGIDGTELLKALKLLTISNINETVACKNIDDFMAEADSDGNGVLNANEFVLAVLIGEWEIHYAAEIISKFQQSEKKRDTKEDDKPVEGEDEKKEGEKKEGDKKEDEGDEIKKEGNTGSRLMYVQKRNSMARPYQGKARRRS